MNFLFLRSVAIALIINSGIALAQGDKFSRMGGRPLLKEFLKELPADRYETVGEKKLIEIKGTVVLNGQDAVEILVDSVMEFNNHGSTVTEEPIDALKRAAKIYVREKILTSLSAEAPALPDGVQENPNLHYTLTLLIKSGARIGIDFAINSAINLIPKNSEKK